jgi:hypothetical protein
MRQEIEVTIGDKLFRLKQLSATDGLKTIACISKIISGGADGLNESAMLDSSLATIVKGILSKIDIDTTPLFISELVKKSVIIPKPFDFDNDFAGNYYDLGELLHEIIKLNFTSLWDSFKKKFPAMEKVTSPLTGDSQQLKTV